MKLKYKCEILKYLSNGEYVRIVGNDNYDKAFFADEDTPFTVLFNDIDSINNASYLIHGNFHVEGTDKVIDTEIKEDMNFE